MAWDQNVFEDRALKCGVVGNPGTARVCSGRQHRLRDRLSGDPGLDWAVAASEADAQHLGRRMFGVSAGADALLPFPQFGGAAALGIPVERGAVFELGREYLDQKRDAVARRAVLGGGPQSISPA
jgi:hypothetical protein